jgi:hypothetical protein
VERVLFWPIGWQEGRSTGIAMSFSFSTLSGAPPQVYK